MKNVDGPIVTHLNMDTNASEETKKAVGEIIHAAYNYKPMSKELETKLKELRAFLKANYQFPDHGKGCQALNECIALAASQQPPAGQVTDKTPAQAAADPITISRAMYEFLLGLAPLDGVWFGQKKSLTTGVYWWRNLLRLSTPQGAGGADVAIEPFAIEDGPYSIQPHPVRGDEFLIQGPTKDNWPSYHDFQQAVVIADMLNMAHEAGRRTK